MPILIVYATTEGQTQKIARFCADELTRAGHSVELLAAADADAPDPARHTSAILAGSVHAGAYQGSLVDYAAKHATVLNGMKTLFLSVSLSAAGDDTGDWDGLRRIVEEFTSQTGFTPGRVEHVAGAFRFTQYDFLKSWAMRWIAAQRKQTVDPKADKEYTDWARLAAVLKEWAPA